MLPGFQMDVSKSLKIFPQVSDVVNPLNTTKTRKTLAVSSESPVVILLLHGTVFNKTETNLIHQYSTLEELKLTVNSALQLKYQCLWQANSIMAERASLRRGPTFLSKCTQGFEARFPYHGSGAMTRSPSPLAWRPDFPGAPREAH